VTSDTAFVIFETEEDRDLAVAAVTQKGGFVVGGWTAMLEAAEKEPESVFWKNFDRASRGTKTLRLMRGIVLILIALLLWSLLFYAPYAWVITTWNYDNGQQPPLVYSTAFTVVVCIGNVIMYQICSKVSDDIGFKFRDGRETSYMLMYTIACGLNILVDMVTTYFMSFYIMAGLHFRTYEGTEIVHLPSFWEKFESYAIQRMLGASVVKYAFPSTYLLPFLAEPIATIAAPSLLSALIVRTHPEIGGRKAEGALQFPEMDLGRYSDILLNVVLGILILFFPGGYTHWLFLCMAASHLYIYAFDHARVLRVIPKCNFADDTTDWWSRVMLAPCCGLILACAVFKGNCQDFGYCRKGVTLFVYCSAVFVVHIVVHLSLLKFVVPLCSKREHDYSSASHPTYERFNADNPGGWFALNPVHCLRSRFIYKHAPPCNYCTTGLEHLLKVHKEIGLFFEDEKVAVEDAHKVDYSLLRPCYGQT